MENGVGSIEVIREGEGGGKVEVRCWGCSWGCRHAKNGGVDSKTGSVTQEKKPKQNRMNKRTKKQMKKIYVGHRYHSRWKMH